MPRSYGRPSRVAELADEWRRGDDAVATVDVLAHGRHKALVLQRTKQRHGTGPTRGRWVTVLGSLGRPPGSGVSRCPCRASAIRSGARACGQVRSCRCRRSHRPVAAVAGSSRTSPTLWRGCAVTTRLDRDLLAMRPSSASTFIASVMVKTLTLPLLCKLASRWAARHRRGAHPPRSGCECSGQPAGVSGSLRTRRSRAEVTGHVLKDGHRLAARAYRYLTDPATSTVDQRTRGRAPPHAANS